MTSKNQRVLPLYAKEQKVTAVTFGNHDFQNFISTIKQKIVFMSGKNGLKLVELLSLKV